MRIPFLLAAAAVVVTAQPYDLVVRNARIWTGDSKQPFADSLAVSGDIVAAVGGVTDAKATRVIDAGGRLITPGFIDSHVHLIAGGVRLSAVQLRDVRTKAAFIERLKAFAAKQPEGAWITGGDWDHESWGGELPTRQWIDAATPKNPVWVNRLDGHMALANSLALKLTGVTRNTRDVPGGSIERDAKGEVTGVLKDNSMELVDQAVPPPGYEVKQAALIAAMDYLAQFGVTSVHDMSADDDIDIIRKASGSRQLKVRVYAAQPLSRRRGLEKYIEKEGRGDRWVRWSLLKGFQDGSLGSKTAAMESAYSDAPGVRGLLVTPPEQLYNATIIAYNAGLQVAIHAIGDRANSLVLDTFERVAQVIGPGAQRMRIEHAQHLRPADVARFAKLGIIASMQPYHLADDGRWAERAIGAERAKTSYAFRSLLDAGVVLAFGSDWFVAPANVMQGIHAAVTRQTLDSKHPDGWVPEQKITVEEALRAYTMGGSYAGFAEQTRGSIVVGKLADLVLIDHDLTRVAPETIRDARILMTVVGGRVVFER